jgi:serine/threonine-protein phosphatase 6 regulatory ankyrin repeat subunit A/serine/threonine-protein phosphatase 6 regulatory ankyrin repeat subunit B
MIELCRKLWMALIAVAGIAASGCMQSPPTVRETSRSTDPRPTSAIAATIPAPATQSSVQALLQSLAALPPAAVPPGKPRFDDLGCRAGEQLPAIPLYDLNYPEATVSLQDHGPRLIITSSLTCPKSRSMYRDVERIKKKYEHLYVVIVYIVEAHPAGDRSPYSGVEDVTDENRRENILCRQPKTMDERIALAKRFVSLLHVTATPYLDKMDNAAWQALGGGPNMAFLIDGRGLVYYRQGWFDPKTMEQAIDLLLAHKEAERKANSHLTPSVMTPDFDRLRANGRAFESSGLDVCRKLLDSNPDLVWLMDGGPRGGQPRTMLSHAVEGKQRDVVDLLLSRGADPNQQVPGMESALHTAARVNDAEIVRMLMKHGASIDDRGDGFRPTPLQEAVIHRSLQAAAALREAGAATNFFVDVASGDIDKVRHSLEMDPSLARRSDGESRTPLCYAAGAGQTQVAQLLINAGAHDEREARWFGESSALYWALKAKDLAMADFLLAQKVSDPNTSYDGRSFLYRALCYDDDLVLAELLARHGVNVNRQNQNGYRCIHDAAESGKLETVKWLYAHGADLNPARGEDNDPCGPGGTDGATPLHLAVRAGNIEVAKFLLDHGARVQSRKENGGTPLLEAVGGGDYRQSPEKALALVKLLLDHGADVNDFNWDGRTALDCFRPDDDRKEIEALLLKHGAKPGISGLGEAMSCIRRAELMVFRLMPRGMQPESVRSHGMFGF